MSCQLCGQAVVIDPCPRCGDRPAQLERRHGGDFITFDEAADPDRPPAPTYAMPCGHRIVATFHPGEVGGAACRYELVDAGAADAIAQLGYIQAQCRIALAAIAEEHEADLRSAVEQLEADAQLLAELVRRW